MSNIHRVTPTFLRLTLSGTGPAARKGPGGAERPERGGRYRTVRQVKERRDVGVRD